MKMHTPEPSSVLLLSFDAEIPSLQDKVEFTPAESEAAMSSYKPHSIYNIIYM